jgi:hypothetical protein
MCNNSFALPELAKLCSAKHVQLPWDVAVWPFHAFLPSHQDKLVMIYHLPSHALPHLPNMCLLRDLPSLLVRLGLDTPEQRIRALFEVQAKVLVLHQVLGQMGLVDTDENGEVSKVQAREGMYQPGGRGKDQM